MQRIWASAFVILFISMPTFAWADSAVQELGYSSLLLRMLLGLGAVCALAVLILKYGVARFAPSPDQGRLIRVIDRLGVEPRRSIMLVEVADRTLVVGLSEAGIQTLADLGPVDLKPEPAPQVPSPQSSFAKLFHVKQSEQENG